MLQAKSKNYLAQFGGNTQITENNIKESTFKNLVPNEEYIIAIYRDAQKDVLAEDNLIFITQVTSDELGNASCQYYFDENIEENGLIANAYGKSKVKKGDIDKDGAVTSFDAYKTLEISVSGVTPTQEQIDILDIDGDKMITSFDAYLILSYSVGIVDKTYWK